MGSAITAGIGIASSIIGGGITAEGQYLQGQSTAAMYKYQSAVAGLNSQIASQNAEFATNQGTAAATQAGMQGRAIIGHTKAAQGASNIAVGGGSSIDVVASERAVTGINTSNILNNAARVAYNYKVAALQDTAQGQVYSAAAEEAPAAAKLGIAGTLVSTAGSVSSKWAQFEQSFASVGGSPTALGPAGSGSGDSLGG